jgi:hypothetical protein
VFFSQNWYVGSQSALDVHEPNAGASLGGLPASIGAPASPAEQLATRTVPPLHVCVGGGKFAALHVVTGEPPPPQVWSPEPHAHSPSGNMQQIPSVAPVVEPPG